jgi:hypothetical protein
VSTLELLDDHHLAPAPRQLPGGRGAGQACPHDDGIEHGGNVLCGP